MSTTSYNNNFQQGKDKEINRVFQYLLTQEATATQVATDLNIRRPNVCRYKRRLEQAGKLRQVKRVICPVTHYPAWAITCKTGGCHE